MVMTRRKMLRSIDAERIKGAIGAAERVTSGEIAVSISRLFWGNVEKAAQKAFVRLHISGTREHNGVLIFVVPSRRRFAVLGDSGIHEKVGQAFWDAIAAKLSQHFRRGDFTEGLVDAIEEVGAQLATHFPYDASSDVNELPNDVDFEC
jgi:uncharacterized membrane protein